MIAKLPFAGFYGSIHDSTLDDVLDRMFSDKASGSVNDPHKLQERGYIACDWSAVWQAYAKDYVKLFAELVKVGIEFESLSSPREYNFGTDRIFVTISEDEAQRLFDQMDKDTFTAAAERDFTSRSGFISFYDPNWHTWGPIDGWDHNQLGTLLDVYMSGAMEEEGWDTEEDNGMDYRIAERLSERGDVDEAICKGGPDFLRILGIHDYLEKRAERG